jgi:hypothetical protein
MVLPTPHTSAKQPPPRPPSNSSHFTLNLSTITLTPAEFNLLDKGLTFIPSYKIQSTDNIYQLQQRLVRNLKLKDYYADDENEHYDHKEPTFTHPSRWTPSDDKLRQETLSTMQKIVQSTERILNSRKTVNGRNVRLHGYHDNLPATERQALQQLRQRDAIIIKPADKGSSTVVMDKSAYISEALRQLNDVQYYQRLRAPHFPSNVPKLNAVLDSMLQKGTITEKQHCFLQSHESDRARQFYLLPKIHKPQRDWPQPGKMPPGRPIVSDTGSESYRISQFLDHHIRPISNLTQSYIRDTTDFIGKIRHQRIPKNAILVTGDVSSLYTNMTLDRIMSTVRDALKRYPSMGRPDDDDLLRLLDITLRGNDMEFNGEFFLQTCGTAMGKSYAPALANIYLEEFDIRATTGFHIKPHFYYRYIDDIFFVWTGTIAELKEFELFLNNIIPGIKVTLVWSSDEVDFLDTTVYRTTAPDSITNDVMLTRVHFKETDTHQLLHKASFHPRHTCKGVLKSQFLRFKRLSSTQQDYDDACRVLMSALASRNYSRRHMRQIKNKVWNENDSTADATTAISQAPVLPIVIPYNELGTSIAHEWREALKSDSLFSNFRLITAYTNGPNLSRKLVRASLTAKQTKNDNTNGLITAPRRHGCYPCNNTRCRAANHIRTCSNFTSTVNGNVYNVRGSISCSSSNLIYLITCRHCHQQYVGETSRPLADRINDHLSYIRLHKSTPTGLHFNLPGHSATDMQVTGIELLQSKDSADFRRMKETTWQNLLQTAHPLGFNNLKPRHLN